MSIGKHTDAAYGVRGSCAMVEKTLILQSRWRAVIASLLLPVLMIPAACYDDGMDELMEMENVYVQELPLVVPVGSPVPGNGGAITVYGPHGQVALRRLRMTNDGEAGWSEPIAEWFGNGAVSLNGGDAHSSLGIGDVLMGENQPANMVGAPR